MSLKNRFGANIRHYRKARDMTQDDLANALGLSVNMTGKIERGVVAPSFDTIQKLAAVFEVEEAALFSIGVATFPRGERGRLLQRINGQLAKLNNNGLAKASKMLTALSD